MRDNSSVLFHLKLSMLSTKGTHQVQIFSQLLALKLPKFLVIFQATSQFSLHYALDKKSPSKYKFSNFECFNESSPNSSCQFEPQGQKFIQILHHCSVSCLLSIFISNLYTLDKKSPSR